MNSYIAPVFKTCEENLKIRIQDMKMILPPASTMKRGCKSTIFLQLLAVCPGIGSLVFRVCPALEPCVGRN